jgi:hypothetical protein
MTKKLALLLTLCCFAGACSRSLDSLEGPEHGQVSGLMCNKLPTLTAALEMPVSQQALISEGHCVRLAYSEKVDVIRTIMMPGDGKYSQFHITLEGKPNTMWIRTSEINPV